MNSPSFKSPYVLAAATILVAMIAFDSSVQVAFFERLRNIFIDMTKEVVIYPCLLYTYTGCYMETELITVLGRIETDIAVLRKLIQSAPIGIKIPIIQASYSIQEAAKAKLQIEAAYQAGVVSYDKKRGMKRSVTVATVGWSPR